MFKRGKDIEELRSLHEGLRRETKRSLEVFHERWIELNNRADEQISRLERVLDEVEHRIDRGNKIWRQIRARESREAEREEEEGWEDELPEGDAGGGREQRVLPLHESMGTFSGTTAEWEEKKRAVNRRLAGLE